MEMVGHNYHFVANNVRVFVLRFAIPFFHHASGVVQNHFVVFDVTKQTFSVLRTNGDEIQAFRSVIVTLQTDGMAVVDVGVVGGHGAVVLSCKNMIVLSIPQGSINSLTMQWLVGDEAKFQFQKVQLKVLSISLLPISKTYFNSIRSN